MNFHFYDIIEQKCNLLFSKEERRILMAFSPNPDQQKAIDTINGALLISAGPGTGKTATLVNRYVNLIEKGVRPENILMATFTEKAAKEIITRISSVVPDLDLNEVYIGTFHSLCLRIVKDNLAFIPTLKKNFTLMDDFDQKYFIYQNFNFAFGKLPHFWDLFSSTSGIWRNSNKLADYVNGLSEEQIDAEQLMQDPNPQIVALGEIKQQYDELLRAKNRLDFSTIQFTAYKLLSNNPDILAKYQDLFQYMMIDEYQDTNSIQERLIFLLSKTKNICVVGDDDQSMYRFRGATIRNILEFESKLSPETFNQVQLTTNYRSAPEIIGFYNKWMKEYSDKFFQWDKYRIEKTIVPIAEKKHKKLTPPVMKISGESVEQWHERIYKFIKMLYEEGHISNYNQIAFLFRSVAKKETKELAKYLETHGVPVYSPRSKMFFEREEIMLAIGILLSIFFDYAEEFVDRTEEWLEKLTDYYDRCLDMAEDLMNEDQALKEWVEYREEELDELEGNTDYAFTQLLYQMFSFDYFRKIIDTDLSSGVADQRAIRNLAILTNVLAKFEANERIDVISSTKKDKIFDKLFETYFRFLIGDNQGGGGMEEYQDESEYAPSGCVSFMTVHQSKGMEFPIVFTDSLYDRPGDDIQDILNEVYSVYSSREEFEPQDAIKYFDFWRRYYVAFSRAEELLVLTTPLRTGGAWPMPSKVFKELFGDLNDYYDNHYSFSEFNFNEVKQSDLKQSYAFTSDISKYERCSVEYKMFRELGFSEIRVGSTMFGSLVHQTIEDIHDAILRDEAGTINENLDDWFENNYQGLVLSEHSYLAPQSKEVAKKYVKNYFDNSEELWRNIRKAEVRLSYPMEDFILNGQIDMIKGRGDTVEIIDFKTGEKPKTGDALLTSYEKQLQVYARLVEDKENVIVSKLKLYYPSDVESPVIEFKKDDAKIDQMMEEFSDVVHKIEKREFQTKTNDYTACRECDMRFYCNRSKPTA
ncbi:ATP-dependent helicase [Bacillus cereus]|uniref:ATP-dependent helicase n=2 Tax=Bacillus TaxID=1386 RepID=UPI00349FBFBC